MFTSLVGSSQDLSNVEKLHYLKSSIHGDAAKLIANIPITDDNYERAWNKIVARFENKRVLVTAQLDILFNLRSVQRKSARELETLKSTVAEVVESLEALGGPVQHWDYFLVYLVCKRLDPESHEAWELQLGGATEPPKYSDLDTFLEARIRALENVDCGTTASRGRTFSTGFTSKPQFSRSHVATTSAPCSCCGSAHFIAACAAYQRKPPSQRKEMVVSKKLCQNCLGQHPLQQCHSKKRCLECGLKHHTSIHATSQSEDSRATRQRDESRAQVAAGRDPAERSAASVNHASMLHSNSDPTSARALLPTALVTVMSPTGRGVQARALLDQGSQLSLVCESLAQALQLPRKHASRTLVGIGDQRHATTRGVTRLRFQNHRDASQEYIVDAHILPRVTGRIPTSPIATQKWSHLGGLQLADPAFAEPASIDLLLGADIYAHLLEEELRKGNADDPVAQRTALGWIVSGPTSASACLTPSTALTVCVGMDTELHDLVDRFWRQEEVTCPAERMLTADEAKCEAHFKATHTRDDSGRYIVRLPFRPKPASFGDSRTGAARMLRSSHRRFEREPNFRQLYVSFMDEYASLRHMEPARDDTPPDAFFLPHHGVLRDSSSTTKLRVVFNGSQKTDKGISLNDFLLPGPKMQTELIDVLLRWRAHPYVFTADIEKMYRQILLHRSDRHYQQILWSESPGVTPEAYRLRTVTYGLTCAPYLAIRVLHQLDEDEGSKFPSAGGVIANDFYVDDLLSGEVSVQAARERVKQTDMLLKAGGFTLQKWATNRPEVLSAIEDSRKANLSKVFEEDPTLRALGLTWSPTSDLFIFTLQLDGLVTTTITKRSILSVVSRLFDPMGWLAPIVIVAKIYLQSLWKTRLGWDDPLPDQLARKWTSFSGELQAADNFSIPRWLGTYPSVIVEIHGFSDASKEALAAVAYVRIVESDNSVSTSLLISKTKVAPLKPTPIARLELSAALLLARLVNRCEKTLGLSQATLHLWTDSSVTLAWVRGEAAQWKEYVGNRVATIQDLVSRAQWRHVPGQENPDDAASRGLSPQQLSEHKLWWEGPEWLKRPSTDWPNYIPELSEDVNLEARLPAVHLATAVEKPWDLVERYSSLDKLLRVTARVFRAVNLFRRKREVGSSLVLTPEELEKALLFWVKQIQKVYFKQEIDLLQREKTLPRSANLTRLTPILDADGLMRVGGRLQNSSQEYDFQHPLILPRRSELSTLVIQQTHERTLHGGVQLTLTTLRQKFWVIGGRAPVRSLILKCVRCARQRGETAKQLMGQLPSLRTNPARPFLHSGVDYAGPFSVKTWKGRTSTTYKVYLVIFICFATSAVHLELSSDYTTEGFLAAYRRFVGRRGLCATVTSDQGTNLVGADAELRRLFDGASKEFENLRNLLASDHTKWCFNPPGAPHFGGKWEAAVKSAKFHLRRVVGEAILTYEEFSTLLIQIESVLNSRPMCPISDDPNDISALTPGHFLTCGPLNSVP